MTASEFIEIPDSIPDCENLIAGRFTAGRGKATAVTTPYTGSKLCELRSATGQDIDEAVVAARAAFRQWSQLPLRERVAPLSRFGALLQERADELSTTVALESGKTQAEARAGIERGLEVVEFAAAQLHADTGAALQVSRGVTCEYRRVPLGVVAGITPFNFPAMVPLWMLPLALTLGNAFVLKPSEKVPASACGLARLLVEAGYPPGVFSLLHGGADVARTLATHAGISAIGFVGSSPAAQAVYGLAGGAGKRALCLGGAKNLMIAAPDCDIDLAAQGIVASFTGCAGQRCMAGSLLALVGGAEGSSAAQRQQELVAAIIERAERLELGTTLGALIDASAKQRLVGAIEEAERGGARVLLDGRKAEVPERFARGSWLGPTVLEGVRAGQRCAQEELFGPVLSVVEVPNIEAALELEQSSRYGNAVSVFTSNGAVARAVAEGASSGMVGVNVGVPVPREPFSFGGTKWSKFGQGDITGPAALGLWSDLKKITTKWQRQSDQTWMS